MTYREEIESLIEEALEKGVSSFRINKYLLREFQDYARHTSVIIMYKYCDNAENRLRGRVNTLAGSRIGTIDFSIIPDNRIPNTHRPIENLTRYYDLNRADWRSFRDNMFIVITAFFNKKTKEYVDTPEEAGLRRNKPDKNYLFKKVNRTDTSQEVMKRQQVIQREQEKREREIRQTIIRQKKNNIGRGFL